MRESGGFWTEKWRGNENWKMVERHCWCERRRGGFLALLRLHGLAAKDPFFFLLSVWGIRDKACNI